MNRLLSKLKELNQDLYSRFKNTQSEVELLLARYSENFPTYTDHSLNHTKEVLNLASQMLTNEEIENLNAEEIYILSMSCILHDIGMCIPEESLLKEIEFGKYSEYLASSPNEYSKEVIIRDIHHELSYDFILKEYENLKIPNLKFARAIALVSKGHRKVQLDDTEVFEPKFFVKNGRDFVCLPYLASILRLADELDITNIRTPRLLTKYYMPNNEESIREWNKHIATTQINFTEDKVIFEVNCSDQNNLAALEDQFEKIQNVSNYTQKIIRNISNTDGRTFELQLNKVEAKYNYIGFDPKGIKFSFNVNNVVNTFIGKDLYISKLAALREVIQNAIDSCRYKVSLQTKNYTPEIVVYLEKDKISIQDNGLGMDEFVIENFFGRLGSSFYLEEKVKSSYDAIGQFGVGVFSYFLLGDYVDIETKTKKNNALKFRIDKDPKNYFHFYDDTSRKIDGTTIVLYLNEESKKQYNVNDFSNYIQSTFRHIEFNIRIERNEGNIEIEGKYPACDKYEDLYKRIRIQHREKLEELELVKIRIDDNDFEGECSLIIPKLDKNYNLDKINNLFDYDSFEIKNSHIYNYHSSYSLIEISQKGVYVNDYGSYILDYVIGKINIKNSLAINLNRNSFSNELDVIRITNMFCIKILTELFSRIDKIKNFDLLKFSNSFLEHYLNSYRMSSNIPFFNELKEIVGKNICIEMIQNGTKVSKRIKDFLDDYNDFLLVTEKEEFKYGDFSSELAVVVTKGNLNQGMFYDFKKIFLEVFGLTPKFMFAGNKSYLRLYKSNDVESEEMKMDRENINKMLLKLSRHRLSDVLEFENDKIASRFSFGKPLLEESAYSLGDIYLNSKHPFVKHLMNQNELISNVDLKKIASEALEIIISITDKKSDGKFQNELIQLNSLITPLYKRDNIYKFTKDDFITKPNIKI